MDSSNYTNRHEQLGVGDNTPNTLNPQEPRDFGNDTLDIAPHSQKNHHGPDATGSSSIKHTGNDAKWNTVADTEIGDPNGRIPTAQKTHEQLVAANSDSLSLAASKVAPGPSRSGHGDVIPGSSISARQHRNSNYAPGYEDAANAVRHRFYEEADHRPNLLSHEPVTPLSEVPPVLHDHSSFEKGTIPPARR